MNVLQDILRITRSIARKKRESDMVHDGIMAAKITARLGDTLGRLGRNESRVGPLFMESIADIQILYSEAKVLVDKIITMNSVVGTDEPDSLAGIVGSLAADAVHRLDRCRSGMSEDMMRIDSLLESLELLSNANKRIESVTRSLGFVKTYLAIESARSDSNGKEFVYFIQELEKLIERIGTLTGVVFEDLQPAFECQNTTRREIEKSQVKLELVSRISQNNVNIAARDLDVLIKLSAQGVEKASQRSKQIARRLGDIIFGMQFHDITRQQIEHVIQALKDLETLWSGWAAGTVFIETAAHSIAVLDLQSAQVQNVIREMGMAKGKVIDGLVDIGREVQFLIADTNSPGNQNLFSADSGDAIRNMRKSLESLNPLVRESTDIGRIIGSSVASAIESSKTVLECTEEIKTVNRELRYKALNAIIKSTHLLDKGKALMVLANEVHRLSSESGDHVSDLMRGIDGIHGQQSELNGKETMDRPDAVYDMNVFSGAYEKLSTCSREAETLSRELNQKNEQTIAKFGFLDELMLDLDGYVVDIKSIGDELREYCGTELKVKGAMLDGHINRYTMQSERDIHHSITADGQDGVHAATEIETDNSCGIEIFDEKEINLRESSKRNEAIPEDDIEFF